MSTKRIILGLAALSMAAGSFSGLGATANAAPASQGTAPGFADPAFARTWTRTDLPVQQGKVSRSWYWGPQPNTGALMEDYDQGPNGRHMVQYFDKTRMEINNPDGDKNDPFYVTNGLLANELITGYEQVGDNRFVLRWPADIPIAGDTNVLPGVAVTYADFRGAVARKDASALGKIVNATISTNGSLDFEHGGPDFANYDRYNVKNVYYEPATSHNIPDVFWQFLIADGPVYENGRVVNGAINDPYFYATGYPISDAYWTNVPINGTGHNVLIQPYQRRVLTYVPDNPAGFKVEMGNVGQHYYDWRYKGAGKPPALLGTCPPQGTVTLGFGKLYNDNTQVKIELGCPQASEIRSTVAYQPFEHGAMLATTRFDFYSGWTYEDIFVLFDDGTVKTVPFVHNGQVWDSSTPTPDPGTPPVPTPPPGLFAPERNFGLIWNATADDTVRQRLGWATSPAQVVRAQKDAQGQAVPGTGGVIQLFDGGMMVYPLVPAVSRKIFVLYDSSGYAYTAQGPHLTLINADHWNIYDDTYQP